MNNKKVLPKYKKSRRFFSNIWNIRKLRFLPRRRRLDPFTTYFTYRQKQILRLFYGNLLKSTWEKLYQKAERSYGQVKQTFFSSLERRLDASLFRLGLVQSIAQAKQKINHGHVFVNGFRITFPGYSLSKGEVVCLNSNLLSSDVVSFLKSRYKYRFSRKRNFLLDPLLPLGSFLYNKELPEMHLTSDAKRSISRKYFKAKTQTYTKISKQTKIKYYAKKKQLPRYKRNFNKAFKHRKK